MGSGAANQTNRQGLLLGVDAGGTGTRAVVASAGLGGRFCVLGVGDAGPGNPLSSGFDEACAAINGSVTLALSAAGATGEPIGAAVFAVAGTANDNLRRRLTTWAKPFPFADRLRVVPDYEPLLALLSNTAACVGVIAGTGSVVFTRNAGGRVRRFGGWGHLLGDEGSGFAIGRRAIRATLAAAESGAAINRLGDTVLQELGVETAGDIPSRVLADIDSRRRIASLARSVLHLAPTDDDAHRLVSEEMAALAATIGRALRSMDCDTRRLEIGLAGGVFTGSRLAVETLLTELRSDARRPTDAKILYEPVVGCLRIAHGSIAE